MKKYFYTIFAAIMILLLCSCLRYMTHDRSEVLLPGIDIDQSLKVAADYMQEKQGEWGTSLGLWALRDQPVTASQAQKISEIYFLHIDQLEKSFDVWHLTWAVANIYRLGNEKVKKQLQQAYNDATRRAADLHNSANTHVNGDKLYMGDAHGGGRAFSRKHLVVPGNDKYLQSYQEYLSNK
ncbi:MAG TPA: hypothetical protein VKS21_07980 [Spirochaetota bacterium]|nr:hypothetical protein [Spirochaetota bacterium]